MNFDNIYIVDYRKLIIWLVPTFLRKVKLIAWLQVLIAPIKGLYNDFLKYRKKVDYKLNHNSQVCYLQKVLNDAFDNESKRIYIENGIFIQALYVYAPKEELPVYVGTQYIYSDGDLTGGQIDFIVNVPIGLKPSDPIALEGFLSDMRALVNEYKLASKTYNIKWIE
ncbi:hypothetical protein [Flagellimonas onchidii]|uniref:hypothetical protein n=1 Tax=Flagellimonas onchidii TaxID=2562684 RepID=UPI0010A668F7|nr:hypothetical protein [Allomuricauda onchidii]